MTEKDERQKEIREKGFSLTDSARYGKIKVGTKTVEDAVIDLGAYKFVGHFLQNNKQLLVAYPIGLFYLFLAWFTFAN